MVSRICELGRQRATVRQISAALAAEGHVTSSGTAWPAKTDGRAPPSQRCALTKRRHGMRVAPPPDTARRLADVAAACYSRRVIVRALLRNGLDPDAGGDLRVQEYADYYAHYLAAPEQQKEQRPANRQTTLASVHV